MWNWLPSLALLAGAGSATRLTPPYISSLGSLPMAETGVGDALLPATALLAVTLAALDKVQRNDLSQKDLLEEEDRAPDLPRPKLNRGQRKRKDVEKCAWAQMLEDKDLDDSNSITSKQFRLDFRVPYSFFLRLGALVKSKDWFTTSGCDAAGRQSHPVEHKVLAWLTILGRGNCFASIYQMSWMSAKTNDELDHVMEQYDRLGFSGSMGSMDVTHIGWSKCPYNLARSYTGKEGVPAIGYQVMVSHAGRAIAVTEGFTCSTNDKTIVCWDAAVEKIRTDKQYTEKTFDVYNEDGTTTTLKGCYLLVDNGYHKLVNSVESKRPSLGPSPFPLSFFFPVEYPDGTHQVPAERERHSLFEGAGERAQGRGVLLRHPEGSLQDPEARHGVPRVGAHRQRVFRELHLAQHAAHLRRNGPAGSLQDPEARHGVPRVGAHRQRVFRELHLAQHAAHLRRNGPAG
ncbi:unnamed protein product [Ectocarpus sp. CCAP 1310/34]|nr:unnamed protein product [Ectocarpus sp. CCAP 1310/34]